MAHGAPDWFNVNPMETFYSLTDLGELAARLGCPSRIDRRGKVIWYDTFTSGLGAWDSFAYGAGSGVRLVMAPTVSPGGAMQIDAGTTMGGNAWAMTHLVAPLTARAGLEWYWTHPGTHGIALVIIETLINRTSYMCGVRYDGATGNVHFWPIAVPPVLTHELGNTIYYPNSYHNYKLVVDFATAHGVYLMVDGVPVDISDVPIYTSSVGAQNGINVSFIADNLTDTGTIVYVDDVVYTWGE